MNSNPFVDRHYSVWVLLNHTQNAISRVRMMELKKYGISAREAAALFCIKSIGGKATPANISRWIFREHHTVTSLLRRMEKKGLVIKTKDLDRKNSWIFSLTEKGQKAYRDSLKMESIHAVLSSFTEGELQQIESNLRKALDQALILSVSDSTPNFP